jgi:hypothetical protein
VTCPGTVDADAKEFIVKPSRLEANSGPLWCNPVTQESEFKPASSPPPIAPRPFLGTVATGILYYWLTSLIVVLAVDAGCQFVRLSPHPLAQRTDFPDAFANWDGAWYKRILRHGYMYDPRTNSSVAFFPAYPLLGRLVVYLTGCDPGLALVLISNVSLAATFVLLLAYVSRRFPGAPPGMGLYVLLAFGLLPTTFFFRMAYTESLFLFLTVLVFYGLDKHWPVPALAAIAGLATATRAVGIALIVPLLIHTWQRDSRPLTFLLRTALLLPLSTWGLAAYMLYLWCAFGTPFLFAQAQAAWRMRPSPPPIEKAYALLTFEPLWTVYDPSSPALWNRFDPHANLLFNMQFANPIYFLLALGLLVVGAAKTWLSNKELAFALLLLLIPYVSQSYELCMNGLGRFAAAPFPIYIVLGNLLVHLPRSLSAAVLGIWSFLLGTYAALFAAWYPFI